MITPNKYTTYQIVDRENEVRAPMERLERMLVGSPVLDCVLFYTGVANVGKTTVLRIVDDRCKLKRVPCAFIDFASWFQMDDVDPNSRTGVNGEMALIHKIVREWASTAGVETDGLTTAPASIQQAVEDTLSFAHKLCRYGQRKPFVLFFDHVEVSHRETFLSLQENLIKFLLKELPALIVMAGRTFPNSAERNLIYPLERATKVVHLRPFDEKDSITQLEALTARRFRPTYRKVIRLTGGLPGLNKAAALLCVERSDEQCNEPTDEMLLEYLANVIIDARMDQQDRQYLKDELLAVSVLRVFDLGLLSQTMQALWPERHVDTSSKPMRIILNRLRESGLVEPHRRGYGYVVPGEIRPLLDKHFRLACPYEHFLVHRTAAEWAAEQIRLHDFAAIIDRLYHLGGLQRDISTNPYLLVHLSSHLQPDPASPERLKTELNETLSTLHERVREYAGEITMHIQWAIEQEVSLVLPFDVAQSLSAICVTYAKQECYTGTTKQFKVRL